MGTIWLFLSVLGFVALCFVLLYLQNPTEGYDNPPPTGVPGASTTNTGTTASATPPTGVPGTTPSAPAMPPAGVPGASTTNTASAMPPAGVPGASTTNTGTLPSTSAIPPTDVPGASTSDPTKSMAQTKDIQATIDSATNMQTAKQLADTSTQNIVNLSSSLQSAIANAPNPDINLLKGVLSSTNLFTVSQLSDMRKALDAANAAYASLPRKVQPQDVSGISVASVMTNLPVPTTVATPAGAISLDDLKKLRDRIQAEIVRIKNLRSSSATLQAKQSQLEQLLADLNQMLDSIQRGKLQMKDVPIQASDANAFLQSLPNDAVSSTLLKPQGTAKLHPTLSFAEEPSQPTTQNLQSLLENAKYLKWSANLNLEFNPELAQNAQYIKRLEDMEKRFTALAMSETPISRDVYKLYMNELQTIRMMLQKKSNGPSANLATPAPQVLSTPDYPSSLQLQKAQDSGFPNPPVAPPGTYRNEYPDIQNRASAASFDPSLVGGLDYKQRVQSMCSQIGAANIGAPAQFGCIDPSSVSASYSWKGNYEMVCSRLGNIWGGWYPEMFGCLKRM